MITNFKKLCKKCDSLLNDNIQNITLNAISCPDFTYRDLKWEAGHIIRASDSLSSGSFTDRQKLEYFPQLVQLVDIGSKKVLY